MKKASTKVLFGALIMFLAVGALVAQDIPVRNWEVPSAELSKMTHFVEPPLPFSPVSPPCRLNDSRVSSGGPGPIPGSGSRNYDFIPGGSPACGSLPSNVVALSLLFTVVNPLGPGFIYAYPTGSPPSSPTSIINYNAGELRNNAVIVPVNPATGSFSVTAGVSGTDLIIDINGVLYNDLEDGDQFVILTSRTNGAAILGQNNSNGNGTHGIGGYAPGTGVVHGVQGQITSAAATGSSGVHGIANSNIGATNPFVAGVFGENNGTDGNDTGVFGWGQNRGVTGWRVNATGGLQTAGVLGYSGTSGVHSFNDITAGGVKSFVEPHPTDPALEIAYISLEGNEAGTYFRGKGRFQNGLARISVPEDFRLVTDGEGLSIQVTPIGEMATVAVLRISLNEIVVKGSRSVEFFYTVNGIRKGRSDFAAVRKNSLFRPGSADDQMTEWGPKIRETLIQNGTLTQKGVPNLETAERLGWKQKWDENAVEQNKTAQERNQAPE